MRWFVILAAVLLMGAGELRADAPSDRSITERPAKVPAHAMRAGLDVTPPRIDRFTPTPGAWVVGLVGVPEVQIGFDEPMVMPIPAGAITAWTVGGGDVTGFTTSYDPATDVLTVAFASPIRDDRLTIVVDFTLTDLAGNELDGEIIDPNQPVLPSGDGVRGGQAVFRINILQGDANRDGVVDIADATLVRDAIGLCSTSPNFDPRTDLNLDGCVNAADAAIYLLAEGRVLPATDGVQPIVTTIREPTNELLNGFTTVIVDFSEIISGFRINERTCFLIDGNGGVIVPISGVQSGFGNSAIYTFLPPLPQCDTYTINISNALADSSGELLVVPSTPPVVSGLVPPPAPVLDTHVTMVPTTSVTITGRAPGAQSVEVSVPALPLADPMRVFTVAVTNNAFSASLTLASDTANAVYFTALSVCDGVRSAPAMTTITHDTQPPELFIDFPAAGAQITTPTTDVAGRVGDMLSGFMGLQVQLIVDGDTANPIPAIVDVGIGSNGTFFAQGVPLDPIGQATTITVVATDELGNTTSQQITATRVATTDGMAQMVALPPANPADRTGSVLTALPAPIVVQMTDTNGTTPFVNKVVTFKVTRSDGRLGATAAGITPITDPSDPNFNPDPGVMMYQVHTDVNGEARAYWRMGHDAGCGNNRVEATSTSVEGTVAFCASALAAAASQLNIGSGNNQLAEAGGPAPEPLRVWASDGQNGKCGVQVTFTVMQGGGTVTGNTSMLQCSDADQVFPPTVASGQSVTVYTDRTGHAAVSFTLGPDGGNHVVEATLVNDPNSMMPQRSRFITFGIVRDETMPTSFTGLVLNNASQPITGATCTLTIGTTMLPPVMSDIDGRFSFDGLPVGVAGPAHLVVDGSTAFRVGGSTCSFAGCTDPTCVDPSCANSPCCVASGTYPSLPFELVIIPNAPNALPAPVLLPTLKISGGVFFDNTSDVTLTLDGMDGLEMLVRAGSVRHSDGTVVDALNPITLVLSQVHADDIPMPIPDGASPPFAWTLQPSGTTFDPPIEITYPNMSGLPAGAVAYFLSFNHASSRFEIVATGHVTDDGSQILSDPGAGLTIAGWGCNCPPYSVTGDCDFNPCEGDATGCCNDRCCNPDNMCCGDPDPCCGSGGPCCGSADRCCHPDNPCCGSPDPCCNPSDPCCGSADRCCNPDNPCCGSDDPCCDKNDPCCGSADPCCNDDNPCCIALAASAEQSLAVFDEPGAFDGLSMIAAQSPCCREGANDPCCNDPNPCCECDAASLVCCGDHCCEIACCGDGCRLASQVCCDGVVPCAPERCCGNGQCCDQACEGCKENGTLSGGMITVDRDPVCVGDTITFTVSGVVDSGGIKRVDCTAKMAIPAVSPTYDWVISRPDSVLIVRDHGPTISLPATKPGTYTAKVTAKANRECPPPDITLPEATVEAIQPDIVFDGVSEIREEITGGLICVNNDDDDKTAVADKDDDVGSVPDPNGLNLEDDLKTLVLSRNGMDIAGIGTFRLVQGSGGQIRLYQNPDRSGPVILPAVYVGSDLPKTLYVEGLQASTTARDITLEFEYADNNGNACMDSVKLSVAGIEFTSATDNEFTGTVHRNLDLISLVNPNPLVQLDMQTLPSTGSPVVFPINGTVTNRIAPLTMQDVTINRQPVQSLQLVSSGNGLGPFVQRFSRNITLPDYDLLIKAQATNALGNSGWDKRVVVADLACSLPPLSCPGTFSSRSVRVEPFTPSTGSNVESFAIEVVDPSTTKSTVTVQINTGLEQRVLELPRVGQSIRFRQDSLYLVPENLALPAGTAQDVTNTRFKGRLGDPVKVSYLVSGESSCEDTAVTVGTIFVSASDGQPVDVALAGLPKDVADGGINRQPLNMITGLPGDATIVSQNGGSFRVTANLISHDFRDDPDATAIQRPVDLLRVSDDPTSPNFNLFQSNAVSPLLPIASDTAAITENPFNLTLHDVHSGGFLRLEVEGKGAFGALQAVEPVRGPIVVNILVDGLGAGFPQAAFAPAVPPNLQTMLAAGLLPNFSKLIGDAAHSVQRYDAHTTFPSITFSAWSSWATGKDPGVHGVTGSNFFRRDRVNDQFWCGAVPDPTCSSLSGMWTPFDHVSFHGPSYPIADNDIANVWSSIGTLNAAIRPDTATLRDQPDVLTIYEALASKGIRSAVVYHFVHRGISTLDKGLPGAFSGLIDHADATGTALDDGTTMELKGLMDSDDPNDITDAPHMRPPQVLTVYYAGLDTNVHNNTNYPAVGATHLITTDRYLGTLVRILEQWNLMDEAMFTFTGDHGLTDVVNDDTHSLLFMAEAVEAVPELAQPFFDLGYNLLDSALEPDFESVLTVNGGMAHVYVRNRDSNWWPDAPRYVEDVLPLAERFYDHSVGNVNLSILKNSIELVLVRDATGDGVTPDWKAPYRVGFRTKLTAGAFVTLSLAGALGFTHPANGLPLIPPGYVDLITNMQRLQDIRSGDIILLSNFSKKHLNAIAPFQEGDPQGRDGGYYFGGQLPSWHGSLYDTDMTIPIIFSSPRGDSAMFTQAVNTTLPAQARITDISKTVFQLLTGENLP